MANPKLHSVLRNETEFIRNLNSSSELLNGIADIYIFLDNHYFNREFTKVLYTKKLNNWGNNLNVVSNRQIFETVNTLISGKDRKALRSGYDKISELSKEMGHYNHEAKYNTKNVEKAFKGIFEAIKTVDNGIILKTGEYVNTIRENTKSKEELLDICITGLRLLFDVTFTDEEYTSNASFESRLKYTLSTKLYDQIDSSLGSTMKSLCEYYAKLVKEEEPAKEEPTKEEPTKEDDYSSFFDGADSGDIEDSEDDFDPEGEYFDLDGEEPTEEEPIEEESTEEELTEEPTEEEPIEEEPTEKEPTQEEPHKDETEKLQKEKEIKAELKKLTGAHIKQTTNDLVATLCELYESGFSSLPHFGILCNNEQGTPLVKFKYEDGRPKMTYYSDEGTLFDSIIMDVLKSYAPEVSRYAPITADNDSVPSTAYMMENNSACHKLHLQFQSANIAFCTGRVSIRKWITETQLDKSGCVNSDEWIKKVNQGKSSLRSFKFVKDWYRWCIENILIDNLYDYGIRPNNIYTEEVRNKIPNILGAVSKNLRNIAVISERQSGVKEEFRVSTDTRLDFANELKPSLEKKLNIGNAQSVVVKPIDYKYGVLSFRVVYDISEENKSQLFAGDIVDNLISSGNTPSWDHALLGKKENGTYFFWDDFMNPSKATPEKRCYTIYAGSRSGKGVMTSTLVAAAMCDGKHVFYTDGKPENGACLGEIAWSKGKEAYVWNGTSKGKDPYSGQMEQYTSSVRSPEELASYINKLPKCLFENPKYFNNEDQAKFLALMRYLKSLSLCASIIEGRSDGSLPNDTWQVWVFDELTAMSRIEKEIRHIFFKYLSDREVKMKVSADTTGNMIFETFKTNSDEEKGKKGEESTPDEGVLYIRKWQDWTAGILSNILNASVISLGKASANLIFIFQEPSWLKTDETKTTICKIVRSLKSTKIAGNKAIPREAGQAAGEYGDATMKFSWINRINDGSGWWVISNSSNIKDGNVTLFKPYTVWTTPLADDGTKSREPLPDDKKTRYLAGYIEKLLGAAGVDPANLLQSAYNYAESAVQTLKFAGGLKEYIYDCSNLKMTHSDSSYDSLIQKLNDEQSGTRSIVNPNSPMSSISLDDGDESDNNTGSDSDHTNGQKASFGDFGYDENQNTYSDGEVPNTQSGREDTRGAESSKPSSSFMDKYSGKGSINRKPVDTSDNEPDLFDDTPENAKMSESAKNLLDAIKNKLIEKTDDESEKDKLRRSLDSRDIREIVTKSLGEVSKVYQVESPVKADYNLDESGNPKYVENESSKNYSDAVSSKNSVSSKFSIGKSTLARKFASWRGIEYETSARFKELIRELEFDGVDFRTVTRVAISDNELYINKRSVDIKKTYLDATTVDLTDIIDFKYMFKKMPNLGYLGLDSEAMDKLYQYYCAGSTGNYTVALTSAFSALPKLIEIDYSDYSGKEHVIRRDMLNSPEIKKQIQEMQDTGILTSKLRLAAYNNIGGIENNKKLTAKARSALKTVANSDSSLNLTKSLVGVGVATGGVALAGAVFGLPVVGIGLAGAFINNLARMGAEASKGSSKS